LSLRNGNGVIPPPKAVDEMVLTLQPHPHLERAVVISQRRCFPQNSGPALASWLQPTDGRSQAISSRL